MDGLLGGVALAIIAALLWMFGDFAQSFSHAVFRGLLGRPAADRGISFKRDRHGHYIVPRVMALGTLIAAVISVAVGIVSLL